MRQKTPLKIIGLMRQELDRGQTILGISKKIKISYRPAHYKDGKKEMIRSERVVLQSNDNTVASFMELVLFVSHWIVF